MEKQVSVPSLISTHSPRKLEGSWPNFVKDSDRNPANFYIHDYSRLNVILFSISLCFSSDFFLNLECKAPSGFALEPSQDPDKFRRGSTEIL